jgi:hypothetical protein
MAPILGSDNKKKLKLKISMEMHLIGFFKTFPLKNIFKTNDEN